MENEFDFFEEKELDQVSVSELQGMVKTLFEKRAEYEELEKLSKEKSAEVESLKIKVLSIMETHNMTKFPVDGVGTVYTQNKYQVSFPKEPDKAAQLRQYLVDNELAQMLTVNHQTLNSFYKSKVEEVLANGGSPTDVLPGVGEPQVHVTVAMRKGK